MAWMVSALMSSMMLGSVVVMIGMLVAQRWQLVAKIVTDGAVSSVDHDQLLLPLRYAA